METAGIVAEYNPFHNGHAWQLAEIKRQLGDVPVIACMSGYFVQRGESSIASPFIRAEMAVRGGVDLVVALPTAYSLRSADFFALGAVQTLAATGLVTHLICGTETTGAPSSPSLPETANWSLTAEAENGVHRFLQEGSSYAAAWEKSAESWQKGASFWFSHPNTILALAYQKTILQHCPSMQLRTLPRQGSDYKEEILTPPYASAAAIRHALSQRAVSPRMPASAETERQEAVVGNKTAAVSERQASARKDRQKELAGVVPETTLSLLEHIESYPLRLARQENNMTLLLSHCLLTADSRQLFEYSSAGADLCQRFYKTREALERGYGYFCQQVANKRDSLPMVQRLALQLMLRHPRGFWLQPPSPSYLRVLAFNRRGRSLLRQMKETASLPVIIKLSDSLRNAALAADTLLQTDIAAADLYHLLSGRAGLYGAAFRTSPFYLPQ